MSLTHLYNGHVAKLEQAIENENLAKLSETLYEVKTNSQSLAADEFYGPQPDQREINIMKDKLHRTIVLAEEALVKFSTKSSKDWNIMIFRYFIYRLYILIYIILKIQML